VRSAGAKAPVKIADLGTFLSHLLKVVFVENETLSRDTVGWFSGQSGTFSGACQIFA